MIIMYPDRAHELVDVRASGARFAGSSDLGKDDAVFEEKYLASMLHLQCVNNCELANF